MSVTFIICFAILRFSSAQLNGEFWWLNDKLKQIKGIEPLPPQFEELTEFDTDESSKITFKDENLIERNPEVLTKDNKHQVNEKMEKNAFQNVHIIFPDNLADIQKMDTHIMRNKNFATKNDNITEKENGDEFSFRFPNEDISEKTDNTKQTITNSTHQNNGAIAIKFPDDQEPNKRKVASNVTSYYSRDEEKNETQISPVENICSHMKKNECYRHNGPLYTQERLKVKDNINTYYLCCILPIITKKKNAIVYPDDRKETSSHLLKKLKTKTTAPSKDESINVESQTIKFQSSPNFEVLQGFKLFPLSKNKFNGKITLSTTESGAEGDTSETLEAEMGTDSLPQVYEHCGILSNEHDFNDRGKETGNAKIGTHPWLAVLVPSTNQQHIVCYATIIHPRAAVTTGDCVTDYRRTSSKEKLMLVAGLREMSDIAATEKRIVTIHSHPLWREEALPHNLALLHWNLPLRLNSIVQPVCLADSRQDAENCKFFGWGGFDQAMRLRPKWQRASTISANECSNSFFKPVKLPKDAICAIVQSRGTVTGLGGSLVCEIDGRATSLGVAVHRDNAVVLLPVQTWILQAVQDLGIV
ncbi:hypothetical protein ACJJTC_006246 [Scirpophaga incertulas]